VAASRLWATAGAIILGVMPGCIVRDIHDELVRSNHQLERSNEVLTSIRSDLAGTNESLAQVRAALATSNQTMSSVEARLAVLDTINTSLESLDKSLKTVKSLVEQIPFIDSPDEAKDVEKGTAARPASPR
jgi:paraquat-inducible protein B